MSIKLGQETIFDSSKLDVWHVSLNNICNKIDVLVLDIVYQSTHLKFGIYKPREITHLIKIR